MLCPGSQNDVTINDGILVTSTDSRRTNDRATARASTTPTAPTTWEGLKVWDVRDPRNPQYVDVGARPTAARTRTPCCPSASRLLDLRAVVRHRRRPLPNCERARTTRSRSSRSRRNNPAAAQVVAEPVLFPDGGNPGEPGGTQRATTGCHDITVYQDTRHRGRRLHGPGRDPRHLRPGGPAGARPRVEDPNFAFWHSATISNDGKKVLFTDENGGGARPDVQPDGRPEPGRGRDLRHPDPANPKFISYFKIPRTQTNTENCVAHNGNLIPVKGRDMMVQSWYQGGISIIDWTNPRNIKELAWFDRGPLDETGLDPGRLLVGVLLQRAASTASEIQRGFDVFKPSSTRRR